MLNRSFTHREKVLLLIFVVLALGLFYYFVAFRGFKEQMRLYDTTELQYQIDTETIRATKQKQMEDYIDKHKGETIGTVEKYNNLSQEVSVLGDILDGKVTDITINWSEPVASGNTVRRIAGISFTAPNYTVASSVVDAIHNCQYRCVIGDLDLSSPEENMSSSKVSVSMSVTFFETIDGVENTPGLIIDTPDEDTSSSEESTTPN